MKIWPRLGSVCQPLEQQNKWFYPASALSGRTDSAWSLSSSETEILIHVPSLAQFLFSVCQLEPGNVKTDVLNTFGF